MKKRLLVGCVLFVGAALAETVTIDTVAGSTTNVLKVFTGATALAVNTGATGGTVRLSPANSHADGTTLGSGVLDVRTLTDIGAGGLTLLGGTFRWAGAAGTEWKAPIVNAAANGSAVVWQIDSDLTVTGSVTSPSGNFIKTGTGTLTFTQPVTLAGDTTTSADANRKKELNLSPDRAPTQGYGPFTIANGTIVIDTPGNGATAPATNVLGSAAVNSIIGVRAPAAGAEATGVLEQRGGVSYFPSHLVLGMSNGADAERPLEPTLRVTGGRLLVGKTGTKYIYAGANSVSGVKSRVRTVIDVSSANRLVCQRLYLGYEAGCPTFLHVHDGGYLYSLDGDIYTGSNSSDAQTTNEVVVTGSGTWLSCQNFRNDEKKGGMTTNFRLADGATIEMRNFVNSTKGKFNVVFDGGVWRHRNHNSTTPHFPSSMTSMKIGPGGLKTFFNNGSTLYPVIWDKELEPLDDSGTDGGLTFKDGSGSLPYLLIRGVNTYCGPTYISFSRVLLGGNGRLPSGTALTVTGSNGGLVVSNGVQTVGSFTFGTVGTSNSPLLGFAPGCALEVTGEVTAGSLASPKLLLYERAGPTNGVENARTTLGTQTIVTAPAASAAALRQIAAAFTFPERPEGVDYTCRVVVEGDRAQLQVVVTAAGSEAPASDTLVVPAAADATVTVASADLSGKVVIRTNPATSGAGTVDLGALDGFAPGGMLLAGSGRTILSDLGFVQGADGLFLGNGTVSYTGPSASIPGLTVQSSTSYSGVLDIPNAATVLTVSNVVAVSGGLTKMGAGTLRFAGTDDIVLPTNVKDNGANNGVAANGDGPTTGWRAINVNGGVLEIGTLGDPLDAPRVYAPYDFSIGSRSHRVGQGVQTAGEVVMNNGVLDVTTIFYIGYYCGSTDDSTEPLYPTLTVNGGELFLHNTLRLGQDGNTPKATTASPRYIQHGGTNEVTGSIVIGYQASPDPNTYRATFTVDGGVLRTAGTFYAGYVNNAIGADVTIADGGRMEVKEVFYANNKNTAASSVVRLASGGVLRSRYITGGSKSYPTEMYFDGGVYESTVKATENSKITNLKHAYLGAGGLIIDTSHQGEYDGPTTYWLNLEQTFEPDPELDDAPDGGITVVGTGAVYPYTGFADSTFKGPIRIQDGARLVVHSNYMGSQRLEVAPGATVGGYAAASYSRRVDTLTLGAADATEPVNFEIASQAFDIQGLVVTNELVVASPVAVSIVSDSHLRTPAFASGVYTALVYRASNPDVDLSKFALAEGHANFNCAFTQETIAGGDLDGMKAVVMTLTAKTDAELASGAAVWTSVTSGGAWGETANWQDGATPPNGRGAKATFNPATKAGVGVTLDDPVTLGRLTFDASGAKYGYTLSGELLTLASDGEQAVVLNTKGTNTIASAVTVASDTELRTTDGNELRLTGGVSGAGDLNVNTHVATGAGRVNLTIDPSYTGKVKTNSGRVAIDDLSFVKSADQLTIGPHTLLYTGPDAQVEGFTISSGTARCSIVELDSDLAVNNIAVSGSSAFYKLGTGTLRLHGTGSFKPNCSQNTGSHNTVKANGDSPRSALRAFSIGTGTFIQGEVDDPENAPTVSTSKELTIGAPATKGDATYILNNGTFSDTGGSLYIGYYAGSTTIYPGLAFIQNGGTLSIKGNLVCGYGLNKDCYVRDTLMQINGGSALVKGVLYLGRSKAYTKVSDPTARLEVNGGSLAFGGNAYLSYWMSNKTSRAFVDLNGGIFSVTGITYFAGNTAQTSKSPANEVTVRLNAGGRWRVNAIAQKDASAQTRLYGNGGAFTPIGVTAAGLEFPDCITALYASTNGFVVDTSELADGQVYTLKEPVVTDPALVGADGGLVKVGKGVLTVDAVCAFTGEAVVKGGELRIAQAGALANETVRLDGGALGIGCGTATIDGLAGVGTVQGSVVVGSRIAPNADGFPPYVTGDVTVSAGVTVDFSAFADGSVKSGDLVPLVSADGAITAPATLKAAPAEKFVRPGMGIKTLVLDGVLYAMPTSGGTMLIFR